MPRVGPEVTRARSIASGAFALGGVISASWSMSLPTLDDRLHVGESRLGVALFMVAIGSVMAMPVAGRLCDRWSSRTVLRIAGVVAAAALAGPILASSYEALLVAAFFVGIGLGSLEVTMNAQAVEVERGYARPIMSSFHGIWSLGAVAGSAVIIAGIRLDVAGPVLSMGVALAGALLFSIAGRHLLRQHSGGCLPAQSRSNQMNGEVGLRHRSVLLLGVVAMAGLVSEGAVYNWAVLFASKELSASTTAASLSYTVFVVAFTICRLAGDRLPRRLGPVRSIRIAGLTAFVGYLIVLLAPVLPWGGLICAYVGWTVVAIGLSTVAPVVFSAAGADSARVLSWVTTVAYVGHIGGPAVMGLLAEATSLTVVMVIPAMLCAVVAVLGPSVLRSATAPWTRPAEHKASAASLSS